MRYMVDSRIVDAALADITHIADHDDDDAYSARIRQMHDRGYISYLPQHVTLRDGRVRLPWPEQRKTHKMPKRIPAMAEMAFEINFVDAAGNHVDGNGVGYGWDATRGLEQCRSIARAMARDYPEAVAYRVLLADKAGDTIGTLIEATPLHRRH